MTPPLSGGLEVLHARDCFQVTECVNWSNVTFVPGSHLPLSLTLPFRFSYR